jgi:hypothetical protein
MEKTLVQNKQANASSSFDDLKALLTYFLSNSEKSLGRTEIMKYVYTFEYYFYQMYGKQFTNLKFNRYYYGPNESMLLDTVSGLQEDGIIKISEYQNYYGALSYSHKFVMHPAVGSYNLPDQVKFVASFILDRLGNENYQGVINFSYSTPPMVEIIKEEERVGRTFLGRVLDMSKTGPIFKSTREQKSEARQRLKVQQQERGNEEEYYSNLLNQYHLFEDTRRRAISAESDLSE